MEKTKDLIIVGAGYAGLTAALLAKRAGLNFALIEARDRVGGRVHTQQFSDFYLDLGAAWVGPTQDRILHYLAEFGLETFPTYDTGKSTLLMNDKLKKYDGVIPPLPIPSLLSLDLAIKKITKLSKKINLEQPWLTPNASYLDSQTLETWLLKKMRFETARKVFRIASQAIWATEPAQVSLLHALFYTKSGRDFDTLLNVKNGAQESRVVGGAQALALKMADEIGIENIHLNQPVLAINQGDNEVEVITAGNKFFSKKLIMALPPAVMNKIDFGQSITANRLQLQQSMPMGSVYKCYAVYDKPFWRDQKQNGLASSDTGYVSVTFDNSPKDGSKGILMGFVLGNKAKQFSDLTAEQRQKEAIQQFELFFGEEAQKFTYYHEISWANEPYSGGCYAGLMPPGVWTSLGHSLREPIGNIHWAGTETATQWNGYMDGAISSGERALAEVVAALK